MRRMRLIERALGRVRDATMRSVGRVHESAIESCRARPTRGVRWYDGMTVLVAAVFGLCFVATSGRAQEGSTLCSHCLGINDTTSSGGNIVASRYIKFRALRPPIAFVGGDSVVRCAVPSATGWDIEVVDPVPGGRGCSIEFDDVYDPLIAYHDREGVLFWARRLVTGWIRQPIDATSVVLGSTSVARVPGGLALAYLDASAGILHYAEQDAAGTWHIENAAQVSAIEAHPSLVVDGNARAISYYDLVHHDLRVAQRGAGGVWFTQVIDATADAGGYSSLVGQPSQGSLGVAYYDFASRDLRYARSSAGGGWTIETVDDQGDVGRFCSAFAFVGSPDDRVGITYYDRDRGDLKYAFRQGGAWTITVLDSAGDAGRQASCGGTPAPDDTLGVAYAESSTGSLKYLLRTSNRTAVPTPASRPLRVTWARSRDGRGGTVRFDVRDAGAVRVSVHDAQGRLLAVPFAQDLPSGVAEIRWDGQDRRGYALPSGVYLIRVETAAASAATSAALLR